MLFCVFVCVGKPSLAQACSTWPQSRAPYPPWPTDRPRSCAPPSTGLWVTHTLPDCFTPPHPTHSLPTRSYSTASALTNTLYTVLSTVTLRRRWCSKLTWFRSEHHLCIIYKTYVPSVLPASMQGSFWEVFRKATMIYSVFRDQIFQSG